LPPVTVVLDGNGWKSIEKVTCRTPEGKLRTVVYGDGGDAYVDLAPAHVLALCKLAGWPKPEVRCEFHYCDGTVCEVDPADVRTATLLRRDTAKSKHTQIELFAQVDGSHWRDVREPVAVVQRMIDVCKEGE